MSQFTVIGGGIIGASTAYHLIKQGHEVTVYDRNDRGNATSASAGIINPWVSQRRNKKWYRLVTKAAKYYPEFIKQLEEETNAETGYIRRGSISLFKDDDVQALAFDRISKKKTDAPEMGEVKMLSREEVKDYHPHLSDKYSGVYVEGGAQVKGALLRDALKTAFIKAGGTWLEENAPGTTEGMTIYATGAWGSEQGYIPAITHQRSEVLHFKVEETEVVKTPVVMALGPIYIVEMGENEFAVGTTHQKTESYDDSPSEENYQYLRGLAERYFPDSKLTDVKMMVGFKPYTRDFLPFIGHVDENTFVINGAGATGLTAGPIIGHEVARFLSGEETDLDLSDYSYVEPENN